MIRSLATIIVLSIGLQACAAAGRISEIGQRPSMTPIENPSTLVGAGASQMPMPISTRPPARRSANSLWNTNATTFFGDPRASEVGDILTVLIEVSDSASVQNSTSRGRTSTEDSDLTQLFGVDLTGFFNDSITPAALTSLGSDSSTEGSGTINRQETISLTVAAIITHVLPNGNLVLAGRQEIRVNNEVRELLITGIARPEDISSDNQLNHTQIAEARISYGGRGHITDVQRPRYGQELYDLLMPF